MEITDSFTLLVPVYNPTIGWEIKLQQRLDEFCEAIGHSIQLFLINDGSSLDLSNGVNYLKERYGSNFKYLNYTQNLGKGGALKFGASHGNTSKYIFTDIDFPYDTKSMIKVWETSCKTPGIIIGHRDESYYDEMTNLRIVLSKGLRWLNRIILKLPVNDTQCGLKAFDSEAKDLLLSCVTDRFLIDLEFLLAAKKSNIQITPVSVLLRKEIDFTAFNSSVLLKETLSFIKLVLRYRF